jgi:hypothetical protein
MNGRFSWHKCQIEKLIMAQASACAFEKNLKIFEATFKM